MANYYVETGRAEIELDLKVRIRIDAFGASNSIWGREELQKCYEEMLEDGSLAQLIKTHIAENTNGIQIIDNAEDIDMVRYGAKIL